MPASFLLLTNSPPHIIILHTLHTFQTPHIPFATHLYQDPFTVNGASPSSTTQTSARRCTETTGDCGGCGGGGGRSAHGPPRGKYRTARHSVAHRAAGEPGADGAASGRGTEAGTEVGGELDPTLRGNAGAVVVAVLHKQDDLGMSQEQESVRKVVSIESSTAVLPAPHWGIFITRPTGGDYFEPPSDLRNYWTDSKNSSGI